MLSDLAQYFTNKKRIIEDNEMTQFFRFIHKHTQDDTIKNCIEVSLNKNYEELLDITYGFFDTNYINDIHLADILEISCDNTLLTLILSTLMSTMNFEIYFEDVDIAIMLDSGDHIDKSMYKISNYTPFGVNHKVNQYINDFVLLNIEDYECDEKGYVADYTAETERFIVSHIKFLNKSIARKIRKAYVNDERVRSMFHELNYHMINGEFVLLIEYNIEEISYYDGIDIAIVYEGILALIHDYLKIKTINKETLSFKRTIEEINKLYNDQYEENYHYNFFKKVMQSHYPPEREVIL